MVLEKYRLTCAPGYVVCEQGYVYRLATLDTLGRRKNTMRLIPFYSGRNIHPMYDLWINGKKRRFSTAQLKYFYEEIKEKDRRIIMLPSNYDRQGAASKMAYADMVGSCDADFGA